MNHTSPKQHYPATSRNREPILEVLESVLDDIDPALPVLEIASGTGEHAVYFASSMPRFVFQPSDADETLLASIEVYREEAALPNLRAPLALDVRERPWPIERAAALLCINMIHIAPIEACEALFDEGARLLSPGAPLYLYGPYRIGGRHTAESNARFDESLRARDPRFGVRDIEAVMALASSAGFEHARTVPMPANNQSLVFLRR